MSSLLSADDLNDFIKPSVACIKPVEDLRKRGEEERHVELEFENEEDVEVEIGVDGEVLQVDRSGGRPRQRLEKAQISLADCLACSGCITSSEEVLIAQHSFKEFLNFWTEHEPERRDGQLHYVLSLSQQARASLANAFDVSIAVTDRVLARIFMEHYGFEYVVSVGVGRRLAYAALYEEVESAGGGDGSGVLASVCPGWVLYVEKTHPELAGRLSRVRSPQYVTCRLVKEVLRQQRRYDAAQVYNLSVMPCFDKKLEASRDADVVECVITPKELVSMLLENERVDVDRLVQEEAAAAQTRSQDAETQHYAAFVQSVSPPGWYSGNLFGWGDDAGNESGGYATAYLEYYRRRHGVSDGEVRTVRGRNDDIYELQLVDGAGEVVCRSGVINGFKNIQNLVRRLKDGGARPGRGRGRGLLLKSSRRRAAGGGATAATPAPTVDLTKCPFVEVMACPSGCINGGGQISAPGGAAGDRQWLAGTRERYAGVPTWTADSEEEQARLQRWLAAVVRGAGLSTGADVTTGPAHLGGGGDGDAAAGAPEIAASNADAAVAVASAGW